ncbi:MAG: hypothetical protein QXG98_05115 [Candidatus Micrarchaeia archaeon]
MLRLGAGGKLALPTIALSILAFAVFLSLDSINASGFAFRVNPLYLAVEGSCILLALLVCLLSLRRHAFAGTLPSLFRALGMFTFAVFAASSFSFPLESQELLFVYLMGVLFAAGFLTMGAWTKRKPFTKPNWLFCAALFALVLLLLYFTLAIASAGSPSLYAAGEFLPSIKALGAAVTLLLFLSSVGYLKRFIEENEEIAYWSTLGLFAFALAGIFFFLSTPFRAFWWAQEFFKLLGFVSFLLGSFFLHLEFAPFRVIRGR